MGVVVVNSPAVLLYDANGVALAVQDGVAIPASTSALLIAGSDGTNAKYLRMAADGTARVDPTGTTTQPVSAASLPLPAGAATATNQTGGGQKTQVVDASGNVAPSGDVAARASFTQVTDGTNILGTAAHPLRNDPTGTTIQPVNGSVTANAGSGTFNNQQSNVQADYDSGAGTQNMTMFGVALPASGGSVAGGTSANPLRTDPTGTTTQPISAASLPLPALAATSTKQSDGTQKTQVVDGLGNVAPAGDTAAHAGFEKITDGTNTAAVTAASALKVDGSAVTQPVSGTTTANQGTANTAANRWPIFPTDGTNNMPMLDAAARAGFFKLTDGTNTQPTADVAARALFAKVTDGTNVQPTGDANARAIFVQVSDGTNGPAAIKAASTAPVAADKAQVVVISPNQQSIPVTATPAGATSGSRVGLVNLGGGSSGSYNALNGTTYTEQTSNAQRSLNSSSASDASAGTGARTVTITYYDSTGAGPNTETITLNGTTAVNTVNTNICFIERIVVATVGSTGANVGTVTLWTTTGGGGSAIGSIGVGTLVAGSGDNSTLWAHHYVATGKTCYITSLVVGASGTTTFLMKAKDPTSTTAPELLISDLPSASSLFNRTYGSPLQVPGPARIQVYGIPASNSQTVTGSFDFYEV